MNKELFDSIIRQNLLNLTGINMFGYPVGDKSYPNYFNIPEFASYILEMQREYPAFYDKYAAGKGNELFEKNGAPPKMASVASSSRFCYLALRNGVQAIGASGTVDVEHACRIRGIVGGTPPQMDAYIENENIFLEVKCHEIFDNHSYSLSMQYHPFLFGNDNDFGLEEKCPDSPSKTSFDIPFAAFGLMTAPKMFDFKQFLCHLLGIKSHNCCKQQTDTTFMYLFFKPKDSLGKYDQEIDKLFVDLQNEINMIFNCKAIKTFTTRNNIKLKAVAQYSEVMSPLTKQNIFSLYPKNGLP